MHVALHFTEAAFALHLLLEGLQRLIDVIIANENLYQVKLSFGRPPRPVRETGEQIKIALRTLGLASEGGLIHEPTGPVQIVAPISEGSKPTDYGLMLPG